MCGIVAYFGYKSISGFDCLLSNGNDDMPFTTLSYEQECLICYFGSRNEIDKRIKSYIKTRIEMSRKNEWVFVR